MKKFVKMFALVTICLMTCTLLFGCGANAIAETVQETKPINLSQPTEINELEYIFTEVPSVGNEIEDYRKEHKKRIETDTLKREEEIQFLKDNGFFINTSGGYFNMDEYLERDSELCTYSDPIVFQSENGVEVWVVNEWGELYIESVIGKTKAGNLGGYYGLIHHTAEEATENGEEIIQSNVYRVISYEPETGLVKHWAYGEVLGEFEVPANSKYVGACNGVGYLFKDGTDVWAVRGIYENDERTKDSEIIAHNVEFVITARYEAAYQDDYLPLFLMTDGTIKCYACYEGAYDDPMDSESRLIELEYEGGYDVTEVVDHYTNYLEVKAILEKYNNE